MSREHHQDIRIGTLAGIDKGVEYLRAFLPHGFESFQLTCWAELPDLDYDAFAKEVLETLDEDAVISSLGVYGNPLTNDDTAANFGRAIKLARSFGATCVCGFAGAQEDRPVDENMPRFKEVWGPLVKLAEDEGIKIGFENCDMGGSWQRPAWNIAHSPRAWEMMFNEIDSPALGLEWEPCHQMVSFVDPIRNLRKFAHKVVHIHGKDATVHQDLMDDIGIRSGQYVIHHRTPGFGDCNWADIITILRLSGFRGSIDIEGWHDPVYRDELEMTGQVYALDYLRACRGGEFIPNPS